MDFPPPNGAVMIWRAGDQLMVRIPPAPGHDRGHILNFPFDTAGVQALKLVLTHREAEPAAKLGSRAVPTQEMLRAMVSGASVTKVPTTSREAQRRERLAKQAALNTEIDDLLDNELDEILEGL